jgi:hypothetical protein
MPCRLAARKPLVVSVKRWRVVKVSRLRKRTLDERFCGGGVVARAEREVALVRPDRVEQTRQFGGGMLAVGIQVRAEVVVVSLRVEVAGVQRGPQPLIEGVHGHEGSSAAGALGGAVGRTVVDDQHVNAGQALAHVEDDVAYGLLFVPSRNEYECSHEIRRGLA